MNKIVLDYKGTERRLGLLQTDKLMKIHIEREGQGPFAGNIYNGIVREVVPGMNAAFVDIGFEKNAYLPFEETPQYHMDRQAKVFVKQGEKLLVRILRDPEGTKGAKISALIEISSPEMVYIKGEHFVRTSKKADKKTVQKWKRITAKHLQRDEGVIIRTKFLEVDEEEFVAKLTGLRERYEQLQKTASKSKAPALISNQNRILSLVGGWSNDSTGELWTNSTEGMQLAGTVLSENWEMHFHKDKMDLFDSLGIAGEMEKAVKKVVWLSNGSYLLFEKTEAMHVIDVNTGKFIGKHDLNKTILDTNILAATEIGRQIILRNLSGIIVIDFINMKLMADRNQVLAAMENALKDDPLRSVVIGFTELGLMQITRKKEGPDLYEIMLEDCLECRGTGLIQNRMGAIYELERQLETVKYSLDDSVWIVAAPSFYTYLSVHVHELKAHILSCSKNILVTEGSVTGANLFEIRALGNQEDLEDRIKRTEEKNKKKPVIALLLNHD